MHTALLWFKWCAADLEMVRRGIDFGLGGRLGTKLTKLAAHRISFETCHPRQALRKSFANSKLSSAYSALVSTIFGQLLVDCVCSVFWPSALHLFSRVRASTCVGTLRQVRIAVLVKKKK